MVSFPKMPHHRRTDSLAGLSLLKRIYIPEPITLLRPRYQGFKLTIKPFRLICARICSRVMAAAARLELSNRSTRIS